MEIVKRVTTETAHIVRNAFSVRCSMSVHGHKLLWEIVLTGPIDKTSGMIIDFKALKPIKDFIDKFDHATILWKDEQEHIKQFFLDNFDRVVITQKNPTAENMSRLVLKVSNNILHEQFGADYLIKEVRVWETDTGCAIADEFDEDDNITLLQSRSGE